MITGFLTVFPGACTRDLVEAQIVNAWSEKG